MSLIRQNDEHWRDNLLGLTFNTRLETEILKRHALDKPPRALSEVAVCSVLHPKTNKILDIGFNCPNDLILDNFGSFLASIFRAPTYGNHPTFTATDVANASKSFCVYSEAAATANSYVFGFSATSAGSAGTKIQLGSGSTAAARGNYAIETAFANAPESGRFSTSTATYGAGAGAFSFSGAISATGADTVNEMGVFASWPTATSATVSEIMLFHDILSSGVAFIAGQTLNASYSVTF